MIEPNFLQRLLQQREQQRKTLWQLLHLDIKLLVGLVLIMIYGFIVLLSATNDDTSAVFGQASRCVLALFFMFLAAQISPQKYRIWIPWIYGAGLFLLLVVLIAGHTGKGAQRWLGFGAFRFQPSEIMKIAVPIMVAWYLGEKNLPPTFVPLSISMLMILVPTLLAAKQPDLGTAILIFVAGFSVILFAGIRWKFLLTIFVLVASAIPIVWLKMHDYQRERILTFLNPESDPLGAGYHIIQSKIAIGSGGLWGKGWFHGTQSHLDFLPEHATDFIFSVLGEEFGFIGAAVLLILYLFVIGRAFRIAFSAYDSFTRLIASSIALTFFFSVFVNIGMVSGILPVVGLPLPLISYGGTSIVTVLTGFGILMSIHTNLNVVKGRV